MMVDKVTAVPRKRLGTLVGSLTSEEMRALNLREHVEQRNEHGEP